MNFFTDIHSAKINNVTIAFATSDVSSLMVREILQGKTKKTKVKSDIASPFKGLSPAGDDNLFPENLRKVINSNYRTKKNIQFSQIETASQGIQPGIIQPDAQGNESFSFQVFPEWRDWNRKWNLNNRYLALTAKNLNQYYYSPVEIVLNENKDNIAMVETKEAWTFRLGDSDENGQITHGYLSAIWEKAPNIEDVTKVRKLPLLFNNYDTATTLYERAIDEDETNFIMLLRVETDELLYPIPDYYPLITQGVIDISIDATKYKKYILKNIVGASVIVYVADWYWENKYSDWKDLVKKFGEGGKEGEKAKNQLLQYRQEVVDTVTELLSGAENAGRIIIADINTKMANIDPAFAKGITIEVIDKKNFTGDYLPDQQEADAQIDWSMGIDPARYGSKPGATNNSGNAKSNAQNVGQINQFLLEELILEVPRLIRDYNKFNPEMEFQIRRTTMVTQDAISPSDRAIQKQ